MMTIVSLLRQHAAGDARPAADAGLRLTGDPLVRVAVNDDRRAVGVEERERTVGERHAGGHRFQRPFAVLADFEIRNVAHVEGMIGVGIGVARGTWIEVSAGGGEVGLTLANRMQVYAMHARLETTD